MKYQFAILVLFGTSIYIIEELTNFNIEPSYINCLFGRINYNIFKKGLYGQFSAIEDCDLLKEKNICCGHVLGEITDENYCIEDKPKTNTFVSLVQKDLRGDKFIDSYNEYKLYRYGYDSHDLHI
jgi:hypothetical protein